VRSLACRTPAHAPAAQTAGSPHTWQPSRDYSRRRQWECHLGRQRKQPAGDAAGTDITDQAPQMAASPNNNTSICCHVTPACVVSRGERRTRRPADMQIQQTSSAERRRSHAWWQ
jgi:hypothetical protein